METNVIKFRFKNRYVDIILQLENCISLLWPRMTGGLDETFMPLISVSEDSEYQPPAQGIHY